MPCLPSVDLRAATNSDTAENPSQPPKVRGKSGSHSSIRRAKKKTIVRSSTGDDPSALQPHRSHRNGQRSSTKLKKSRSRIVVTPADQTLAAFAEDLPLTSPSMGALDNPGSPLKLQHKGSSRHKHNKSSSHRVVGSKDTTPSSPQKLPVDAETPPEFLQVALTSLLSQISEQMSSQLSMLLGLLAPPYLPDVQQVITGIEGRVEMLRRLFDNVIQADAQGSQSHSKSAPLPLSGRVDQAAVKTMISRVAITINRLLPVISRMSSDLQDRPFVEANVPGLRRLEHILVSYLQSGSVEEGAVPEQLQSRVTLQDRTIDLKPTAPVQEKKSLYRTMSSKFSHLDSLAAQQQSPRTLAKGLTMLNSATTASAPSALMISSSSKGGKSGKSSSKSSSKSSKSKSSNRASTRLLPRPREREKDKERDADEQPPISPRFGDSAPSSSSAAAGSSIWRSSTRLEADVPISGRKSTRRIEALRGAKDKRLSLRLLPGADPSQLGAPYLQQAAWIVCDPTDKDGFRAIRQVNFNRRWLWFSDVGSLNPFAMFDTAHVVELTTTELQDDSRFPQRPDAVFPMFCTELRIDGRPLLLVFPTRTAGYQWLVSFDGLMSVDSARLVAETDKRKYLMLLHKDPFSEGGSMRWYESFAPASAAEVTATRSSMDSDSESTSDDSVASPAPQRTITYDPAVEEWTYSCAGDVVARGGLLCGHEFFWDGMRLCKFGGRRGAGTLIGDVEWNGVFLTYIPRNPADGSLERSRSQVFLHSFSDGRFVQCNSNTGAELPSSYIEFQSHAGQLFNSKTSTATEGPRWVVGMSVPLPVQLSIALFHSIAKGDFQVRAQ